MRKIKLKKVGILTFHRAANYGAVLQSYALQNKIQELGADCEVIDYVCEKIERNYNPSKRHSEKLYVKVYKWIYGVKKAEQRYSVFQSFLNKYINLSSKEYNQDNMIEIESIYDVVVVGSDQVWNREITGGDNAFFLEYVSDKKKKYSYAASAGDLKVDSEETEIIREKIKDFSGVSIREENLLRALEIELAQSHIDPVFLMNSNKWSAVAEKTTEKKFVLVYSVRENWELVKTAQKYAKKNKLELIYIYSHFNLKEMLKVIRERCHAVVRQETVSPEAFVGLIRDAECVFTNSFHGAAFSIIFHKRFWADVTSSTGKNNKRLEELLKKFELEECSLKNNQFIPNGVEVDWNKVDHNIRRECASAEAYIESIVVES